MSEITINLENLTEQDKAIAIELAEKAKKPKEWPEEGEYYWWITSDGCIRNSCWENRNPHIERKEIGNCFQSPYAANKHREHLKVCAELARMADYGGSREPNVRKWHVWEDNGELMLDWEFCDTSIVPDMYQFATKESCQHAIDTIGAERLIKYYFRRGK